MKFNELDLNKNIQKSLKDLEFINLTEIQEKTVPFLLNSKNDIIGLAQTGTGKTAAFGLPIINSISLKDKYPQAIILCPTRELCIQITKDLNSYSKYEEKLRITSIYGGANIQTQIKSLERGSHIIVGTPGRVIDLIKRRKLKLSQIDYLVLDEADEMLNMGFKEDLDTILNKTPKEKQNLLFSATMPKEVLRITKNYMQDPEHIEVAKKESLKNIEHHYYMVNAKDKYKTLRRICDVNPEIYGIVFCRTRRDTKEIAEKLSKNNYNADSLHGDLSQSQRDHVMKRFRQKNIQILVATDVAARGIDINDLSHVINYNLPDDNEVYIHRAGRTGRIGKKGISIIIAHSRENRKLKSIEKILQKKLLPQEIPTGADICKKQLFSKIEKIINTKTNKDIDEFTPLIEEMTSDLDKTHLIKKIISLELHNLISVYKNAPDLNKDINNKTNRKQKQSQNRNKLNNKSSRINKQHKEPKENIGKAEKGYSRFFINIGKKQDLESHNLIGLINESTRNRNINIGKIDIMRKFSFFEVENKHEEEILTGFKKTKFKGTKLKVEISKPPNEKDKKETIENNRKPRRKNRTSRSKNKGKRKQRR